MSRGWQGPAEDAHRGSSLAERIRMCLAEVGLLPVSMIEARDRELEVLTSELTEIVVRAIYKASGIVDPENVMDSFADFVRYNAECNPGPWMDAPWARRILA